MCGYLFNCGFRSPNYHFPKQSLKCTMLNILESSCSQMYKKRKTWIMDFVPKLTFVYVLLFGVF